MKEDYGSLLAFLDQQQNKALLFLFHEKKIENLNRRLISYYPNLLNVVQMVHWKVR